MTATMASECLVVLCLVQEFVMKASGLANTETTVTIPFTFLSHCTFLFVCTFLCHMLLVYILLHFVICKKSSRTNGRNMYKLLLFVLLLHLDFKVRLKGKAEKSVEVIY